MARRRRQRQSPDAMSHSSLDDSLFREWSLPTPETVLSEVEDRRRFNPDDFSFTAYEVDGRRAGPLVVPPSRSLFNALAYPSARVRFEVPDRTIVCVRRKERREVFFAKKLKRGRGGGRRTKWSDVQC